MRVSMRVLFLFVILMSSALLAPAAPRAVTYARQSSSVQHAALKAEINNTSELPNVDLSSDENKIQFQLLTLLEREPAFQGVGTQLTSEPGVTTYRIYVNRRLLQDDKLPASIQALLADPARYLYLPLAPGTPSGVAAGPEAETACVGPWCFKPVRMEPLRAFSAAMGGSTSVDSGCSEGTVGVHVADNTSGATGYVTNNHVATAEGPLLCPNARSARQVAPGTKATMCHPGELAGRLQRRPEIAFTPQYNLVDAAFVKAGDMQCDGCGIHPNGSWYSLAETASLITSPLSAPNVQKCGTEGPRGRHTFGKVVSNNAWVRLIFLPCGLIANFAPEIEIEGDGFAQSGDSGAWVFDAEGKAVGMIFAGDEVNRTFVNPADAVLSLLDVRIVPCP